MTRDFTPGMHHGLSEHLYYTKWANMLDRCYNPQSKPYKDYGGRGIYVFEDWRKDAEKFIQYILELPKKSVKHNSIDRINNDEGYIPGNLRWATKSQQSINTRHQSGIHNVTKVAGVYKNRSKYRARISINGKRIELGSFGTFSEAVMARRTGELEYYIYDYNE